MTDSDPVRAEDDPRRILAMGGGGFTMYEPTPALDKFVLALSGKPVPRICFLPTASGDPCEQVMRFYERYEGWPCEPSVLSLFNLRRDRVDPIEHLLRQDVIYVGGGSMRNMLAIWREHRIDEAMWDAWNDGVIMAGLSAGAMCWFEGGVSMSGGSPEPVQGLGLLPGSLSVHLDGDTERLPAYRSAIATGQLPGGYAVGDGAALLYAGTRLLESVASEPGSRILRLRPDPAGGVIEAEFKARLLDDSEQQPWPPAEAHGVAELRALRGGRYRWD